jgi:hypothetical protein
MPLTTWESVHFPSHSDPSVPVFQMMGRRIHDDAKPMPQPPNARLSDADAKTLDDWIAAGAPAGTAGQTCQDAGPLPDSGPPVLSCTTDDLTFAPAAPYQVPASTEVYVCYGFDAPAGSIPTGAVRHALGITPKIDNAQVVHHMLLYQADNAVSSTPAPCDPGGSIQWRIVYGWAPGGGVMKTPTDVGFPYDQTTHWVVQLHYNNISGSAVQADSSGFSLCTTDQPVKYDADVVAFGTQSGIDVKAHAAQDITCSITVPAMFAGVHLFSAFPHMHKFGTAIQTKAYAAGSGSGAGIDLGHNAPWNFNNQLWFPIDDVLNAGDVVKTRCAYQNNTSTDVSFGPTTEDEMCYSFTAYYPKINSSLWSWDIPALQSKCAASASGGI